MKEQGNTTLTILISLLVLAAIAVAVWTRSNNKDSIEGILEHQEITQEDSVIPENNNSQPTQTKEPEQTTNETINTSTTTEEEEISMDLEDIDLDFDDLNLDDLGF